MEGAKNQWSRVPNSSGLRCCCCIYGACFMYELCMNQVENSLCSIECVRKFIFGFSCHQTNFTIDCELRPQKMLFNFAHIHKNCVDILYDGLLMRMPTGVRWRILFTISFAIFIALETRILKAKIAIMNNFEQRSRSDAHKRICII